LVEQSIDTQNLRLTRSELGYEAKTRSENPPTNIILFSVEYCLWALLMKIPILIKFSALRWEIFPTRASPSNAPARPLRPHARAQERMTTTNNDTRVPVTILTGYLGSGKTTLVNHILTNKDHGKKIAIIENEFGDVGIDDALMAKNTKMQIEEEVVEMMNGCICCTVRQDLVVVLDKFSNRIAAGNLKLDCILIETTGMADPAPVAQTFFVDDNVKEHFRLDGIVTLVDAKHIEQHLDEEKPEGAENEAVEQVAFADRMILNKMDLVDEADVKRVEARLKSINSSAPIVRAERSAVSVDSVLDIHAFDLKKTVDMDPEFLNTENKHEHDDTVSSISVVEGRPLDLDAIQRWVNYLLVNKGTDLYRMKGVLNVADSEERFMFQAVHMIFNGDFDEPWAEDEKRQSKFVFIGRNLDHDELKEGFLACIQTPEMIAKKERKLRFAIGDDVVCRTSDGWVGGKIIEHFWRNDYMPPGVTAPYKIRLDDGKAIWAPEDDDRFIRAKGAKKAKTDP
jgi:G3E family GTPase